MAPVVEAVTEPVWLGEGPHWDHDEQALYFVSMYDHTINKYVPDTGKHTKANLGQKTSFIIPIDGQPHHFVVGLNRTVVEIRWDGEESSAKVVRTVAELDNPVYRFNDGKADPRGRLFAGTMGAESGSINPVKGSLYRIDADGGMYELASDVNGSNGLCWDLEQKAFYYIATRDLAVRRYDYDVDTGNISNPKIIFECKSHGVEGVLDGMTIDTHGNLWICNFFGSQVLHLDPRTGTILQKLSIPAPQTTSATFGGPALDVLYVTTAKLNLGGEQQPPCGATFKVTGLGVTGHQNVKVRLN